MPKKKKKGESIDPHEGRPKELTFADFIVIKKLKGKNTNLKATETASVLQGAASSSDNIPPSQEATVPLSMGAAVTSSDCETTLYCSNENVQSQDLDSNQSAVNCTQTEYYVCRTKKGGIPVKVESRASGKKVTLIEHVLGDGKLLLSNLKSKFGTGGQLKEDTIELQGDLVTKVSKYFNENKQLLKPYGTQLKQ